MRTQGPPNVATGHSHGVPLGLIDVILAGHLLELPHGEDHIILLDAVAIHVAEERPGRAANMARDIHDNLKHK